MREKKEIDRADDKHRYDDETDVRAKGRLFLAGDSTSDHDHEIESETRRLRHFFFSDKFLTKTGSLGDADISDACYNVLSARPAKKKAAASLPKGEFVEAGVSPAKSSNAADTAASTEDRIPGNWGQDIHALRSGRARQIIRICSQDW